MKKFFAALVLLLALVVPSFSQDLNHTDGFINGRYWAKMTVLGHQTYIEGYQDGASLALGFADKSPIPVDLAPGVTVEDLVAEIDAFYQLKETGGIPVVGAIIYIGHKKAGATVEELKKHLDFMREKAGEKEPVI